MWYSHGHSICGSVTRLKCRDCARVLFCADMKSEVSSRSRVRCNFLTKRTWYILFLHAKINQQAPSGVHLTSSFCNRLSCSCLTFWKFKCHNKNSVRRYCYCGCSILSSFFLSFLFHLPAELHSLLLHGNKRDRLETCRMVNGLNACSNILK